MEDRTTLTNSENKLQYCDMSGTILRIKNKANCAAKERPGDYRDKNGFLVCGTCGQPREAILPAYETENFTFGGGRVPITCRCDEELEKRERRKQERARFGTYFDALCKNTYSVHDAQALVGCTFEADDGKSEAVSKLCRGYAEHWPEMSKEGIGLLLYGGTGTGKSFFAAAIANALLDNSVSACFTSMSRIDNALTTARDKQEFLDALNKFALLIIDDFGMERDTQYMAEKTCAVIDARLHSGRPLVVTTNLPWTKIANPESMQQARIFDRLLQRCQPVKLVGTSRRAVDAGRLEGKFMEIIRKGATS